jgi:hypothetical protein
MGGPRFYHIVKDQPSKEPMGVSRRQSRHRWTRVLHSTPLDHTAAHETAPEDPATAEPLSRADLREPNLRRAAFRDLHGARLHGFALLVSLGDRPRAARAAAEALEEGTRRSAELRHPERAAAWLRARVLRQLRHGSPAHGGRRDRERRAALHGLGVADPAYEGLAALAIMPRAALVASTVERFDPIDVETILGLASGSSLRMVARARQRYLTAVAARADARDLVDAPGGELGDRVREVAGRAMGAPARDAR